MTAPTTEDWESVERAIWPHGPAHGRGSNEYAILKARVLATLDGHLSLSGVTEAALGLLAAEGIHGGLPNGYCAVCQGQCLRTWADGPKRWDAEDCPCGQPAYRPEPVAGRRQALRCRGCHHIVGRCTCLVTPEG